ncbi:ATP-binding cassette domain-containing protein [Microbacterium sp. KSW4-16]|uniref:ATP-binding cassette domain-containing protein n=1 Tax=Microbacterium aurugineum TaxID=2851642 RepID=UPI0020BF3350|nr:ATP-binding cassette domain-containing protein [Microbacterium aurugineum]MCK8468938.1 ATP-binding cassette domain-containing protein [Microbacterium aurugineum]
MPEGQVLEFTHVTKRFNEVTAVSDFSARVEPGAVTAFLGPNGAGKTTTLRILLGQVRATSGTATIGGTAYAELRQPLRTIGAVLEETVYRPRRTAERQLTIAAKANGIPLARVGEVLSLVGLDSEGDSRIGGFSLGMRQRLSVAHALLGDPGALVFDEPANGLDPEGIRWMRLLMRRLADEGRTVLVSSHVLSEVEQVADNVLVLSKGRLVLASGIETLADPQGGSVIVDAADRGALRVALDAAGFDIEVLRSGLTVRGGDAGTVGAVAAEAGIALSTLVQRGPTLEDVFIDLMRGGRLAPRADTNTPPLDAPVLAAAPDAAATDAADAESTVAIPVAAAAAWAAEAAAAPAGEAVGDDLAAAAAASATADEDSNDGVSELFTPEADDETPVDAAPVAAPGYEADEPLPHEDPEDRHGDEDHGDTSRDDETDQAEEPPARSFDEILFGAAAPVASPAATADRESPRHDVAEVFTTSDDPETDTPAQTSEHDGTATDDTVADDTAGDDTAGDDTAGDEQIVSTDGADAHEDDAAEDDAPAGVEIFADLDTAADVDGGEDTAETEEDADPRSAAVSSMLAAAARAYYEDEPKDYPLGQDAEATDDAPVQDGAHWSVASTGVIDTVPLAESESDSEESSLEESGDAEATDGQDHDGENHDGQNHHGETHHG